MLPANEIEDTFQELEVEFDEITQKPYLHKFRGPAMSFVDYYRKYWIKQVSCYQ